MLLRGQVLCPSSHILNLRAVSLCPVSLLATPCGSKACLGDTACTLLLIVAARSPLSRTH